MASANRCFPVNRTKHLTTKHMKSTKFGMIIIRNRRVLRITIVKDLRGLRK